MIIWPRWQRRDRIEARAAGTYPTIARAVISPWRRSHALRRWAERFRYQCRSDRQTALYLRRESYVQSYAFLDRAEDRRLAYAERHGIEIR